MKISIPYGRTALTAEIPDRRIGGVIESGLDRYQPELSEKELVQEALRKPVGSRTLAELSEGAKKVVIICSDHTRPVPSRLILPPMLEEIRKGNPQAEITLLIASGCHRSMTGEELEQKFGSEILSQATVSIHDSQDKKSQVYVGILPSGGELWLNRLAMEADLLLAEGFIEPHFFAGYSGGRKSVLPGIAAAVTVHANHCSRFIDSPYARYGSMKKNPMHLDMVYAARKARLAFIVNVVINSRKEIIGAFAGDCEAAHEAGCKFLDEHCMSSPVFSDIVIVSNNGYPMDQNMYQSVKGMATAERTCSPGGVIIMVAECEDGIGGESFYRTFKDCDSAETLMKRFLDTPPEETIVDQWQSQIFARVLIKHKVIFVSSMEDQIVRDMHMIPASSLLEAIGKAERLVGKSSGITVIPEGISNIIRQDTEE